MSRATVRYGARFVIFLNSFFISIFFGVILYPPAVGQVLNQFSVSVKYIWFRWIVLMCYFSDLEIVVARPPRLCIHGRSTHDNL